MVCFARHFPRVLPNQGLRLIGGGLCTNPSVHVHKSAFRLDPSLICLQSSIGWMAALGFAVIASFWEAPSIKCPSWMLVTLLTSSTGIICCLTHFSSCCICLLGGVELLEAYLVSSIDTW